MNNMNSVLASYNTALGSAGSAERQNEVYMDSLNARLNLLKAQFEQLVLGDGGLSSFIKGIVSLGTAILKFANSDLGQLYIKLGLASLAVFGLYKAFVALKGIAHFGLISNLVKAILSSFIPSIVSATTVTEAFNAVLATNPILFVVECVALLTAGVYLLCKAFKSAEHDMEGLNELVNISEEAQQEVESLENQLDSLQSQIDAINENGVTITEQDQLDLLEKEEASLKRQLSIALQKAKLAKEEASKKATEELTKETESDLYSKYSEYGEYGGRATVDGGDFDSSAYINDEEFVTSLGNIGDVSTNSTYMQTLQEATAQYQYLTNVISTLEDEYSKLLDENGEIISGKEEEALALDSEIQYYKELKNAVLETGNATAENIEIATNSVDTTKEGNKELVESNLEVVDSWNEITGATDEATKYMSDFGDEEEEENDILIEEIDLIKQLKSELDTLMGAFDSVRKAREEYNSQGYISIETFEKLMSIDDNYISLLFDEEGALKDTTEAEYALYDAKIDEIVVTKARNLVSNAQAYLDEHGTLEGYTDALSTSTDATWDSVTAVLADMTARGEDTSAIEDQIRMIVAWGESAKKGARKASSSTKKSSNDTNKALKSLKSDYEDAIKYLEKLIDKQIDSLKDQKKIEVDSIKAQIDALKEKQDAEEKYWDDKIKALKEQNEALEDQIELEKLEEDLAEAKSKRVMVFEGGRFVYKEDTEAISQAQQAILEYNRKKQYEDQLALLEKQKENAKANYDSQIKDLEDYLTAVEEKYDEQINLYEKQKEAFKEMTNAYENEQSKLLVQQLTGIDLENNNWMLRLDNLTNFVNEYNKILAQLDDSDKTATTVSKDDYTSSISGKKKTNDNDFGINNIDIDSILGTKVIKSYKNGTEASKNLHSLSGDDIVYYNGMYHVIRYVDYKKSDSSPNIIPTHSSGTPSVPNDQLAIVGEDPNKEIVVGSKLNNGQLVGLSKGSGVVNSQSTKTLAGLLNSFGSHGLGSGLVSNSTNASTNQNFNFDNLVLPNVSNANSFVTELKNMFGSYSIQYATSH